MYMYCLIMLSNLTVAVNFIALVGYNWLEAWLGKINRVSRLEWGRVITNI